MFKYTISKMLLEDLFHLRNKMYAPTKERFFNDYWECTSLFKKHLKERGIDLPYAWYPHFLSLFTYYSPKKLSVVPMHGHLIPAQFFDETKEIQP